LDVAKLDPASNQIPDRFETGTKNHEGIAGLTASIEFLASLAPGANRRERLVNAMSGLHARGRSLFARLWQGLGRIPGVRCYGPPPERPRTPTVSFTLEGVPSASVASELAQRGIFVSHGDFYATTVAAALGHEEDGLVRAGCACYTSEEEIERLIAGVARIASRRSC